MMKRLYDIARGVVRVEVSGAEPESILNFCAESGIEFWDADPCEDYSLHLSIHAADYPALEDRNGKNGIEITLLRETGGKKFIAVARARAVLLSLMLAGLAAIAASSLFIWRIDIEGNDTVSSARLMRALEECGVGYGTFWPAMSSDRVKDDILTQMPDIAWLSVNIRSSCAHIVVHERVDKPEIVNEKSPCDIVAAKGGVIKKLSVLEGEAAVTVGDTVAKGDVLVRAVMSSETGDDRFVHSMAQVQADTWYEISAQVPLTEQVKVKKEGTSTQFSLIIGKKRINFFNDSRNNYTSCDKINKLRYISLGDVFTLPVGYAVQKSHSYETQERAIDEKKAILRLKADLEAELKSKIGNGEIVSQEYSVSKGESVLTVTLRAQCTENIAKESAYD